MKIITSGEGLVIGDVLQVATELIDKRTGQAFWWRRFACVIDLPHGKGPMRYRLVKTLTLKLEVDMMKDVRIHDIHAKTEGEVIYLLGDDEVPQGVHAMKMKQIHLGNIVLGDTPD